MTHNVACHELTDTQRTMISDALRRSAELFAKDAEVSADCKHPRLQAQFLEQQADALGVAEWFADANRVVVEC